MLLGFIAIGTLVYHFAEGWSWLDAYYFSVMTLSTVGYGDMTPSTQFTKIFTTVYVLAGLGVILNFVTVFFENRNKALKNFAGDEENIEKIRNNTKN